MTYVKQQVRKRPLGWIGVLLLAGVAAYLLSTAFAGASSASPTKASANVLTYINVAGAQFQHDSGCSDGNFNFSNQSGALHDLGGCTYEASFSLPSGLSIVKISAFYAPETNGGDADFNLEATSDFGNINYIFSNNLPDCGNVFCSVTYTRSPFKINNADRHYGIHLPVGTANFTLYRFRIGLINSGTDGTASEPGTPGTN